MSKITTAITFVLISAISLFAENEDFLRLHETIQEAYDFDKQAMVELHGLVDEDETPLHAFLAASADYWLYQADRMDTYKQDIALESLSEAIRVAKEYLKQNKRDLDNKFFVGLGYCNRARYYVEEQRWFKAYLDAREGMGILKDILKHNPNIYDANFALGVAETFLSDAPVFLKPLARLLGFKGSAEKGIARLRLCMESGTWTGIEAEYYLAYYYYNVAKDGPNAVENFSRLFERFPNNPMFGYFLGRSYQISHRPLDALEVYRKTKEVAYSVEAFDIGNWCSYRIGNILHGEHFYEDAIVEYRLLKDRIQEAHHSQEYFYRLPLKFGKSFAASGNKKAALAYLNVIKSNWDSETYKKAQELIKELEE